MLKVLSNILCDLDPKVKVIGRKAGICDGVPSTSALVIFMKITNFMALMYVNIDYLLLYGCQQSPSLIGRCCLQQLCTKALA